MNLNYREFGKGENLIILHGLFGSLDNWQSLARKFSDEFHVYTIDQRNHGKSPHTPDMSIPLMAADLAAWMEVNKIASAHIIGHSMGGKTAMQMAVEYPTRVNRLIVVDISPRAYSPGHSEVFHALNKVRVQEIASRSTAESEIREALNEEDVVQFLMKGLQRKGDKFSWKFNLEAIEKHYNTITQAVRIDWPVNKETLFIRGGNSSYITDEDWDEIQTMFPKAILKTIPGAGHWVHAERPRHFYDAVISFLTH